MRTLEALYGIDESPGEFTLVPARDGGTVAVFADGSFTRWIPAAARESSRAALEA